MSQTKLHELQATMKVKGTLTKTQLRYTQRVYSLNNKILADLFHIKQNSLNALKAYALGSGNYNVKHMHDISSYLQSGSHKEFKADLSKYGMILTYSAKSWRNRIRSAKLFKTMEDFDTQLCRWLIQDNLLLDTSSIIISTKELSNIMHIAEKDVPRELSKEGLNAKDAPGAVSTTNNKPKSGPKPESKTVTEQIDFIDQAAIMEAF